MSITVNELNMLAAQVKIGLEEQDTAAFCAKLNKMLECMKLLQDIDLKGVPETISILPTSNVFREDEPRQGINRELALALSPDHEGGYYKVPKIL